MNTIWYYAILVLLVAVDGEIAILAAAGAASTGFLNPVAVFFAGAVGNVFSDSLWYALGYYGQVDRIIGRFKWIGVTTEKVDSMKSMVDRDVIKLLTMAKLTNWMTIPVLVATGASRVPPRRWFPLVVISNFAISLVLVLIGYYMGSSFLRMQTGLEYAGIGFTLLFILFILFRVRKHFNRIETAAAEKELTTQK